MSHKYEPRYHSPLPDPDKQELLDMEINRLKKLLTRSYIGKRLRTNTEKTLNILTGDLYYKG